MDTFYKTEAFGIVARKIFRGLIIGDLETIIDMAGLGVEAVYVSKAGELAYNATDRDVKPAVLAMVINARIGWAKAEVFGALKEFGVTAVDIDSVLYENGGKINYRKLWDQNIAQTLVRKFSDMERSPRVALVAHTITVLERTTEPQDAAPAHIRRAVIETAQALLPLAEKTETPLEPELRQCIKRATTMITAP